MTQVIAVDENGDRVTPKTPYYDVRKLEWVVGTALERRGSHVPECPRCKETRTSIVQHRHMDSDGIYHHAVYKCRICGHEWGEE